MILAEAPKTHIIYSYNSENLIFARRIYFCGIINYDEGIIEWDWTEDINKAVQMTSADAWNIWDNGNQFYKNKIKIEVQRIKGFEEILSNTR